MKHEENEPVRDFESEFYETEYIDEDFPQFDPDSIEHIPAESTNNINSDAGDCTKFICDYCGKEFDKKSHIASHMVKHKNEVLQKPQFPETFPCTVEGCRKEFEKRKQFNNHRLLVHNIKPEPRPKVTTVVEKKLKLYCQQCPKWFTIQQKLDAHIREKHKGLKVS